MLSFSARMAAPAASVQAALTNPDQFRRWWSAWAGCEITSIEIEPHRGGAYRIATREKSSGRDHYIQGRALTVHSGFLAATWESDASSGFASTVYLRILDAGENACHVSIEHHELSDDTEARLLKKLWPQILRTMEIGIPRLDESGEPPEVVRFLADHTDWHITQS